MIDNFTSKRETISGYLTDKITKVKDSIDKFFKSETFETLAEYAMPANEMNNAVEGFKDNPEELETLRSFTA